MTHLWPSPVRQFFSNYSQQSSDESRWKKPSRKFSLLIEPNVGTISMRCRDGNHCYSKIDSMFRNQLCVKLSLNTNNHVTLLAVNGLAAHGLRQEDVNIQTEPWRLMRSQVSWCLCNQGVGVNKDTGSAYLWADFETLNRFSSGFHRCSLLIWSQN